jgi:hypothetical protein
MKLLAQLRSAKTLLLASFISTAFVLSPVAVHNAGAALGTCGGCLNFGPMVTFADGSKLNTGVVVDDRMYDVYAIHYTVHVPEGMTVDRTTFQGSRRVDQSIDVFADNPANTYSVDTVVTTGSSVTVWPKTSVNDKNAGVQVEATNVGLSNQDISLQLQTTNP